MIKIQFNYDKANKHPPKIDPITHELVGLGYDFRPYDHRNGTPTPLVGIVWHSTEGSRRETWKGALEYIVNSPRVSAHYYISQQGEIERILDPGIFRAWHAGESSWGQYSHLNDNFVGIELHHTKGMGKYPIIQIQSLVELTQVLLHDHDTIQKFNIVPHRWIAIPFGRKYDPSDLDDKQINELINSL